MNPRSSSLRDDIIGGFTTFLAMSYIVVVNPSILATEGTGMAFSGVLTATVLLCTTMTFLMGAYARLPFGVAPGMGVNAFFTFTLVLGQKIPWQVALGIVFWAGVLFLLLSVIPLREAIVRAIHPSLRTGMSAGIGTFLTFIGLRNAGLIAADPVTFVRPGTLDMRALLAVLGVAIVTWLMHQKNPFAFIAGIAGVTALGWLAGLVTLPSSLVSSPDFHSVFLQLDIVGALKLSLVPPMLAFLFTDLFDSLSTFIGVAQATGLTDADSQPKRLKQGLIVDAFATLGAGLMGTSSGTAYIESAAGINAGGRSGRAAVVTALCFVPCFFIAPLVGAVPQFATASALILVGALMFQSVTHLDFSRFEEVLPAFLTMVLIPFTFSITQGILWGFIAHVGMFLITGRRRDVHPMMYPLAAVAAGLLWLEHGV